MKVIITGATGMVGEGVMMECISNSAVESIILLLRRPSGIKHPKVKEAIIPDLFNMSSVERQFAGYDACFFCLGVSSVGMNETDYTKVTYDLTMYIAGKLSVLNPGMVFCYVSGAATDSTEKGRMMWARVKGKTENDLRKLPFKSSYGFRPGFLIPSKGAKNVLSYYKYFTWLVPVLKLFAPQWICSLSELGRAMIQVTKAGYPKNTLEVKDIKEAAKK
ncbi:MAG TPA: hypothetical protein VK212_10695 [Lentimicrobium sp.]|nr:hypothetical protein [Lentimicrobium sp.]